MTPSRRFRAASSLAEPGPATSALLTQGGVAVEDADRFFGRERVLDELDGKLARLRFLAVFGPSGAGKSSLLRAGFVPRRADSAVVLFSPGPHPFEECALQLAPLLGTTAAQVLDELTSAPDTLRLLLRQAGTGGATVIVDQFEELFTLCLDPAERTAFLDALLTAASGTAGVVLGVRADFYPRCAEHRGLSDAVAEAQLLLGPMTAIELRDAIVKPAVRAGLSVEGALVTELVAEAHAQPGILPLLSHALRETWHRRRGATLALSGYHATGGIRGALANTAEAEYSSLDESEQTTAQQLFLRLIALGEDTGATRRRLRRDELDQDDPRVEVVLNRLAASRLVTLDADTVELTHEALIDAWPRLRDWLAENRAGLQVHRQLTDAATTWEETNREPDALARGTRLAVAREWAETGHTTMTSREREFLHASVEAERAAQRRAGRRTRQLRWLSAGLAVLLAGAVVLAGAALLNQRTAAEQRQIAQSRQFSAQADALAEQDPGQAARLSVDAINAYSTVEARGSLLSRIGRPAAHGLLAARGMAFGVGALSPDGRWFAGQDTEHNTVVWDLPKRVQAAVLRADSPMQKLPMTAAFSGDSTRLVVAMADDTLLLWTPAAPQHPLAAVADAGDVRAVAFSRDGTRVATITSDQTLEIRDSASLRTLVRLPGPLPAATSFGAVAFSPDGRTLATTGGYDQVLVRDATTGAVLETLPSKADSGRPLAFDADGTRLAFPDRKGNITVWDMATHQPATTVPEAGNVSWLAFDPGSGNLITGGTSGLRMYSSDLIAYVVLAATSPEGLAVSHGLIVAPGTAGILVWDIPKLPITAFGRSDDVVFADGGSAVLGAGGYAVALRRWKTAPPHSETPLIPQPAGPVMINRLSHDGAHLALASLGGNFEIYDVATRARIAELATPVGSPAFGFAFDRDGRLLAAGYEPVSGPPGTPHTLVWDVASRRVAADLPVRGRATAFDPRRPELAIDDGQHLTVWDIVTGKQKAELPRRPVQTSALAYSPDGSLLAAGGTDGKVALWDPVDDRHLADMLGHTGAVDTLAFSPDGHLLATGGADKKVVLWDVARREAWANLAGAGDNTTALGWNNTGTILATTGLDGFVSLWPVDIPTATRMLCTTLSTDFPATPHPESCPAP